MEEPIAFLSELGSVLFGAVVQDVSQRFENDSELRYELVSNALNTTFEPIGRDYYEEEYGQRRRLRDWPYRIINREKLRIHLKYLDKVIGMVEGSNGPVIVTAENVDEIDKIDDLRSFWLSEPEYARKVRALRAILVEAVDTFSQQMVLRWISRALNNYRQPSYEPNLTREEVARTYCAVEDCIYRRGCQLMTIDCQRAYREVAAMPQSATEGGRVFHFTEKELNFLHRAAISQNYGLEAFADLESKPAEQRYGWAERESGLIVPSQNIY